jgi:hypothetical protein
VVRPPTPSEEPEREKGPDLPQPAPDVVVPPGPEVITPPRPQEIPAEPDSPAISLFSGGAPGSAEGFRLVNRPTAQGIRHRLPAYAR